MFREVEVCKFTVQGVHLCNEFSVSIGMAMDKEDLVDMGIEAKASTKFLPHKRWIRKGTSCNTKSSIVLEEPSGAHTKFSSGKGRREIRKSIRKARKIQ